MQLPEAPVLEHEIDSSGMQHFQHQLEASHRNLERMLDWVGGADNKALIALTFQGAIIAGVAVMADPLRKAVTESSSRPGAIVVGVLLTAFFVVFSLCSLRLFHVISPRIQPVKRNDDAAALLFFGSAAAMDPDEYAARIAHMHPQEMNEGLARMAHTTAIIATQKYAELAQAYRYFGYETILFLAVLFFSLVRPLG